MPQPGTSWQIQYEGTIDLSLNVKAYDLDVFDTTKAMIDGLHARGIKATCYFSAGTYENWRPDVGSFPSSVLGSADPGWSGERWLDVRQLAILTPIMTARMDIAVQKGCDALDPDNVDGYENQTGFSISAADQLAYNTMLANEGHKRGLSVALKNDIDQVTSLVNLFDFAVNEECIATGGCNELKPFITSNKAVLGIEYTGSQSTVCPIANSMNFDTLLKHLALDAYRVACR